MDLDKIKTVIEAMATSDLAELELIEDGWTLRLSRMPRSTDAPAQAAPRAPSFAASVGTVVADSPAGSLDICAPLSGVVYLRPAPDKPPFVSAGQVIAAGEPVCLIEAMKVFNEVRADCSGLIATVLVASGSEVEAGQPLLRLASGCA